MERINAVDLKKRKLEKFFIAIYVVNKTVKIRTDTCIEDRELYVLWGIDIIREQTDIRNIF